MNLNRLGWSSAVVATALVASSCGETDAPEETTEVQIGAVVARTGTVGRASWGRSMDLARDHVNEALRETGFRGLKFAIPQVDSQTLVDVALEEAQKFADKGVVAIIGDNSANSVAIAKTYYDDDDSNDLGVPYQCSTCSTGSLNNPAIDPRGRRTRTTGSGEPAW